MCATIAAASILAKTSRDAEMRRLDQVIPATYAAGAAFIFGALWSVLRR
jgi:ribonuclease HII